METFVKEIIEGNKFELVIDSSLFSKEIVFKSAFLFLDKWYFFFKKDFDGNIVLQFTKKDWVKDEPKVIIWDFSNELLNNILREKLFQENKEIRTEIITSSIQNSLREAELPNSWRGYEVSGQEYFEGTSQQNNEIDFDKDIDDILKEIESDPDLKIDEAEIEKILKEIEEESMSEEIPEVSINMDGLKKAKKQFDK